MAICLSAEKPLGEVGRCSLTIRTVYVQFAPSGSLAQLVEQRTLNPLVECSNHSRPTNNKVTLYAVPNPALARFRDGKLCFSKTFSMFAHLLIRILAAFAFAFRNSLIRLRLCPVLTGGHPGFQLPGRQFVVYCNKVCVYKRRQYAPFFSRLCPLRPGLRQELLLTYGDSDGNDI